MSQRVQVPNGGGTTYAFGLNEIGHQGKFHDETLGLTNWNARIWHPQLGRFPQRDPHPDIYPDGLNTYAGYHIMWGGVDPSGRRVSMRSTSHVTGEFVHQGAFGLEMHLGHYVVLKDSPALMVYRGRVYDWNAFAQLRGSTLGSFYAALARSHLPQVERNLKDTIPGTAGDCGKTYLEEWIDDVLQSAEIAVNRAHGDRSDGQTWRPDTSRWVTADEMEVLSDALKDEMSRRGPAGTVGVGGLKTIDNAPKKTSKIDRKAFRKEREAYWKREAAENPEKYSADDLAKMKKGKAPAGSDGYPKELHHVDRTPDGGLEPMDRTDHRLGDNYKKNHPD